MAKKTLLDNIIESIKDVDGRLIKQSGTTEQMISDLNYKVVAPAKSAADSAVAYANDAIEKSRVNSQAIDDINSAVSDAASAAAVARSDGLRAWNAAQSNVNLIDLNYASASASISSARTEAIAAADEAKASASAAQADIVAVRSDVAAVQADVTANKSDVAVAKSDIAVAKTDLTSQATSLSSYVAQASAAGEDITTLKSQAGHFEQEMADTKGDVSQLKISASSASLALSDAAGNISSLQATAKSYSAALSDTNSNVASVTATARELETKYADAAGDISQIKTDAKGMTQTVSDAQGDIAKLKTRADGFDAEFATANGNISKLQTDATGTTQTLANTKSDVAVLQSRADGIDAKYANAAGDINTLKANASGFSQTLTDAKGDISTLQSTVTGFKNTLTDAQGNISTLQSDVTGLKKTTSDNKGNISSLQVKADSLTSQMSNAQGDISTLKQTASGFSSKVSGMETSLANANSKIDGITSNGGGRNLLRNSTNDSGKFQPNNSRIDNWSIYANSTVYMTQGQQYTVHADASDGLVWSGTHNPNVTSNNVVLWLTDTTKISQIISDANTGTRTTFTWNHPSGTYYLRVNTYKSDNSGYVERVMLENGTVAHDWSPAPEDTDAKITTNTTAIEQNKNAITLKANQTDVDKINGTVNQLQSSLTVQAGQIQTKVSASDVSGMLTGYATQEYTQSLVTQKADEWNVNLTSLKTEVNAIDVTGGGVNLQSGTSDDSGAKSWTSTTYPLYDQFRFNFEKGKTYTFSYDVICNTTPPKNLTVGVVIFAPTGGSDWTSSSGFWDLHTVNQGTTHVESTFTIPYNWTKWGIWRKPNEDTTSLTITNVKLERGSVATPYSPAPSDMATVTSVTNLAIGVEGVQAQVYNSDGSSKITQLSNLIATKVSQGDYNSQITQLKNDINLRVAKGDVISQINQEAGGNTLIQVSNGKKSLILDAANTIITGEAWIPSAAIGSISADKVMLGSSALYNSDGTLNLVNQNNNLKALIQVKQGLVQDTTQSIISFSSDYNNRAFSITPVGATVTPTLFFERYDQTAGHWLGFTRNEVRRDGLMFNTWDNEGERFFVGCHARFDRNISANGAIYQGTWNGTNGKPLAGVLSIETGNTIWSGSDYLAIGDHLSNSFTNVMARSFSQQSTLSSKTNIEAVDPKYALDLVNKTDIRSYQYKSDVALGKTKRYTSLIIDDVNDVSQYYAPDEFTNEERTGRDDGSAVGYLFLAIQELTRRIKTLEDKLNG